MPRLYTRRSFQTLCASLAYAPRLLAAHQEVITDTLHNWTKHAALKNYAAAFEFLQSKAIDFKTAKPQRFEIRGQDMYATLSTASAKSFDSGNIEAHHHYADIHYLVDGAEVIGSSNPAGLDVVQPYKESSDVELFKLPANCPRIEMVPGQFAVFMPGQGHLPGRGSEAAAIIRKVVVKCRV